jgi:hypothetical protein
MLLFFTTQIQCLTLYMTRRAFTMIPIASRIKPTANRWPNQHQTDGQTYHLGCSNTTPRPIRVTNQTNCKQMISPRLLYPQPSKTKLTLAGIKPHAMDLVTLRVLLIVFYLVLYLLDDETFIVRL